MCPSAPSNLAKTNSGQTELSNRITNVANIIVDPIRIDSRIGSTV